MIEFNAQNEHGRRVVVEARDLLEAAMLAEARIGGQHFMVDRISPLRTVRDALGRTLDYYSCGDNGSGAGWMRVSRSVFRYWQTVEGGN